MAAEECNQPDCSIVRRIFVRILAIYPLQQRTQQLGKGGTGTFLLVCALLCV